MSALDQYIKNQECKGERVIGYSRVYSKWVNVKTFQDLGGNGHFFIYKVLLVAIYFLSNLMKNRTECLIEVYFKLLGIPDFRKTLENVSIA